MVWGSRRDSLACGRGQQQVATTHNPLTVLEILQLVHIHHHLLVWMRIPYPSHGLPDNLPSHRRHLDPDLVHDLDLSWRTDRWFGIYRRRKRADP